MIYGVTKVWGLNNNGSPAQKKAETKGTPNLRDLYISLPSSFIPPPTSISLSLPPLPQLPQPPPCHHPLENRLGWSVVVVMVIRVELLYRDEHCRYMYL